MHLPTFAVGPHVSSFSRHEKCSDTHESGTNKLKTVVEGGYSVNAGEARADERMSETSPVNRY